MSLARDKNSRKLPDTET